MDLPDNRWLYIIGLIVIVILVLFCGVMLPKGGSVSNLYIIPAGVFSPGRPSSGQAPQPVNTTPAGIVPTATPILSPSVPVTVPASTPKDRSSLNVLRGEPFTINGTVDNLTIKNVQVWLLNGSISATIIPVMPDGTFQVTLDSR